MSQPDHASEPSMEDILASIRRIISDDGGAEGQQTTALQPQRPDAQESDAQTLRTRDSGSFSSLRRPQNYPDTNYRPVQTQAWDADSGHMPAAHYGVSNSASSLQGDEEPSGDDVFDLTDELILDGQDFANASRTEDEDHGLRREVEPHRDGSLAPFEQENSEEPASPELEEETAPSPQIAATGHASAPPAAADDRPRQFTGTESLPQRPSGTRQGAAAAAKSIWSRRELPGQGSMPPFSASSPSFSKSAASDTREAAVKNQTAPRWPQNFQAPVPEEGPLPFSPHDMSTGVSPAPRNEQPRSIPATGESLKAKAGQIAKTAVTGLSDNELADAGRVDFEHLSDMRKQVIAESFASAVSREALSRHKQSEAGDGTETKAASPAAVPDMPSLAQSAEENVLPPDLNNSLDSIEAPGDANTRPLQPEPDAAEGRNALPAERPPVAVQANPATRSLEDSVREMLRPMLVDWLNENMPRILENAIREEIRSRALNWTPDAAG